jgi:hypothetical protein
LVRFLTFEPRLILSIDAVEGDVAEDSPLKKKSTPAKGKGKGKGKKTSVTAANSEDETSPVKQEVDEACEDGA